MQKSYTLSVHTGATFELDESSLQQLDAVATGHHSFHVLKNNRSHTAEIIAADFVAKKYTIKVNNNTYEVSIADELDQLISRMGIVRGRHKVVNAIKAPMPGLILEINVQVGDAVQENDPLLILEAMKMENSFLSPREGKIKSIAVVKGQAVDKGQLLIEFES